MNVKELLLSSNYWVLNKDIVKHLGWETAGMLSVLAEADKMFNSDDGWFFQTGETIEELTGMTKHKQAKAINKLKDLYMLKQHNQGIPMKRYFLLNYEEIQKQVFKEFKNCKSNNLKTSSEEIQNNKESTYKESIDKENNYKEIVEYLNGATGKSFKHTTKSTQSKIKARLKEGFTYEDFKRVIDAKVEEWGQDSRMAQYLRPDTLFSPKFESYLNQVEVISQGVGNDNIKEWMESRGE